MMLNRQFSKLEAAGNDFIFLDAQSWSAPSAKQIQSWCDRVFGVGADGLVRMNLISPKESSWEFFNRDASKAEMCGNAARAAAAWLADRGVQFPHLLRTEFGEVVLDQVADGRWSAKLDYTHRPLRQIAVQSQGQSGELINTGVPHLVLMQTRALDVSDELRREARAHRFPKEAGSEGANVTYAWRDGDVIEVMTFERGVEDFTLSCGTGMLAAAVVSVGAVGAGIGKGGGSGAQWPASGVKIRPRLCPSAALEVRSESFPRELILIGPARLVFEGRFKHLD